MLAEEYQPERHTSLDAMGAASTPLTNHEELTVAQIEKQVRMRTVLEGMRRRDVEMLVKRYVALSTLEDIAAEEGVTAQAIWKRLQTAQRHFETAHIARWGNQIPEEPHLTAVPGWDMDTTTQKEVEDTEHRQPR